MDQKAFFEKAEAVKKDIREKEEKAREIIAESDEKIAEIQSRLKCFERKKTAYENGKMRLLKLVNEGKIPAEVVVEVNKIIEETMANG